MTLESFKFDLDREIEAITGTDFKVTIKETEFVPGLNDPEITGPNLRTKEQICKLIETCILFIDIRKSTEVDDHAQRTALARLYSSFIDAIVQSANYYNGQVRHISDGRVMVLFDKEICFTNAVNTAILMNSVSQYVANKYFERETIKCGIGIDYGKILATKPGIAKQGQTNEALAWLGTPVNIAAELTEAANKAIYTSKTFVCEGFQDPSQEWSWCDTELADFLNKLEKTSSSVLRHSDQYFNTFFLSQKPLTNSTDKILMTEKVFNGFKNANPSDPTIRKNAWIKKDLHISGSEGIYGGNVIFHSF
jgi:adenylate cyclase